MIYDGELYVKTIDSICIIISMHG